MPPLLPPKVPSPDDMLFFDRVRTAIDNRDVYNEFLKLINLFSQEIIDMRTLVERSKPFLGEELLSQLKDILGWDASWENSYAFRGPGLQGANSAEGLERPTKEALNIQRGPSYCRLPASVCHLSTAQAQLLTMCLGSECGMFRTGRHV